jgi:hypothetical protein
MFDILEEQTGVGSVGRSVLDVPAGTGVSTVGVLQYMMEGKTMGWLWSGRSRSRTRPRVAIAGAAARIAYQTEREQRSPLLTLGSAMAATDQIGWAYAQPTSSERTMGAQGIAAASALAPARREDFGEVGALIERAEQTAKNLGRSRAEMWEEALRIWLETQGEEPKPAPRPWLFEARRQRTWGEIDQMLSSLRTA